MEVVDHKSSSFDYDGRAKEVEEFSKTKAGVKGLVDSGVAKIPRFFVLPAEILHKASTNSGTSTSSVTDGASESVKVKVPMIDLEGCTGPRRAEIVGEIGAAAEEWGFFQMVNHGIPKRVMEDLKESIRRFHEQPNEQKMKWYSQDVWKRIRYYSYGYLHSLAPANWRDTLACNFQDLPIDMEALPQACR